MKNFLLLVIVLFFYGGVNAIFAQGCSDAGFCSIEGAFKNSPKEFKNTIDFGLTIGAGESDVTYISPYLSYTRNFSNQFSLNSKITYSNANGSFGNLDSFGDIYFTGNYHFPKNNKWSAFIGTKIPLNTSNKKIDAQSLPMDYQSSLGTLDLLLGVNYNINQWDFNAALQIPIVNYNKNSYFKEFSNTTDFVSTNLFERKSDALFRATYTLKSNNQKWVFQPNILSLYHLGEDHFINRFNQKETIKDSDGLTINGNIITKYIINQSNSIDLSLATPFVVRDVRPDGLTRKFTATVVYHFGF
ncbi:MAG: hypothetical protein V4497_01630 [Bacteroidota bacterium]